MLIDHDKKYVFFHIPKTAGQAVVTALGHKHEPTHHNVANADDFRDYFRFCFVRHPVERFISAYRYSVDMTRRGHAHSGHPVRMLIAEKGLENSAQSFVEAVSEMDTKQLFSNLHFRPQMRWLQPGRPQFIGRHETLAADLGRLGQILDMDIPETPAVVNKSRSNANVELDDDAIAFLHKLYVNDFRLLGYHREWSQTG